MSDDVHYVKVYSWKRLLPKGKSIRKRFVILAYKAAIKQEPSPMRILIRSEIHDTTYGKYGAIILDPKGDHVTYCYKNQMQFDISTHVADHAYTFGPSNFDLREATFAREKYDETPRSAGMGPVWPEDVADLEFIGEFGFKNGELVEVPDK